MILRDYQVDMVSRAEKALGDHGNSLLVAPTGSGKTVMLSSLMGRLAPRKALVLQHRDELLDQNIRTFLRINEGWPVSVFNADTKDSGGRAVFAMAQTLHRHLDGFPMVDLLVIDEAHHGVAPTYKKIVKAVREGNPNALIAGFTATPARGDGKGLRDVFDNVCGRITLQTLIRGGHLVAPKTFVVRLEGVPEALQDVRRMPSGEYDMDQVGEIMNRSVHNLRVVEEWKRVAAGRRTIVFCSTCQHADDVAAVFASAGVSVATVTSETPERERADMLARFDRGEIEVITNVAVLTEGYDSQAISCVVLLRPCSYKSTMIQMIGRGLRTVTDSDRYPGVMKTDCLVLDFGTSLLVHGDLEAGVQLDDRMKICRSCGAEVPQGISECPICGAVFEYLGGEGGEHEDDEILGTSAAELVEIDILKKSPFKWCDLFGSGKVMVASGFEAQVFVVSANNETFTALGKIKGQSVRRLTVSTKPLALAAADDFLREFETDNAARKSKRWLRDAASEKQLALLHQAGWPSTYDLSFTKYSAACHLNFAWARNAIERYLSC